MDERTTTEQTSTAAPPAETIPVTAETAATEHRTAYGSAKTENLRDSGRWRIVLPAFVVLLCIAVLAIPQIILIPLFVNSLDVNAQTHNLTWLWTTMIVLEMGIAAIIIYGLLKIFLTQAGNYRS
jgi:ABC-type bacteriocin/lantibiotic exporter with double-glycine peptidase domain